MSDKYNAVIARQIFKTNINTDMDYYAARRLIAKEYIDRLSSLSVDSLVEALGIMIYDDPGCGVQDKDIGILESNLIGGDEDGV